MFRCLERMATHASMSDSNRGLNESGHDGSVPVPNPAFVTTHWTVVLAAQDKGSPQSEEALESLCRTYINLKLPKQNIKQE